MKFFKRLIILSFYILGLMPQDVFASVNSQSLFTKFELKNCTDKNKKCLKVEADKAESSQFIPVYSLNNINIQFIEAGRTRKIEAETGYLDFAQDLIVLNVKSGKEILINLKTLEEKSFQK
jgi:hypothetical protein